MTDYAWLTVPSASTLARLQSANSTQWTPALQAQLDAVDKTLPADVQAFVTLMELLGAGILGAAVLPAVGLGIFGDAAASAKAVPGVSRAVYDPLTKGTVFVASTAGASALDSFLATAASVPLHNWLLGGLLVSQLDALCWGALFCPSGIKDSADRLQKETTSLSIQFATAAKAKDWAACKVLYAQMVALTDAAEANLKDFRSGFFSNFGYSFNDLKAIIAAQRASLRAMALQFPEMGVSLPAVPETTTAVVTNVHDGDTVTLDNGWRVRLIGIDAPELGTPRGVAAQKWLESKVLGKTVTLKVDTLNQYDAYGRVLGTLFIGDLNLNRQEYLDGYAALYKNPDRNKFLDQDEWKQAAAALKTSRVDAPLAALKLAYQEQLANINATYTDESAIAVAWRDAELDKHKSDYDADVLDARGARDSLLAEIKEQWTQGRAELSAAKKAKEITAAEYKAEYAALRTSYYTAKNQINASYKESLASIKDPYVDDKAAIRATYNAMKKTALTKKNADKATLRADYVKQTAEVKAQANAPVDYVAPVVTPPTVTVTTPPTSTPTTPTSPTPTESGLPEGSIKIQDGNLYVLAQGRWVQDSALRLTYPSASSFLDQNIYLCDPQHERWQKILPGKYISASQSCMTASLVPVQTSTSTPTVVTPVPAPVVVEPTPVTTPTQTQTRINAGTRITLSTGVSGVLIGDLTGPGTSALFKDDSGNRSIIAWEQVKGNAASTSTATTPSTSIPPVSSPGANCTPVMSNGVIVAYNCTTTTVTGYGSPTAKYTWVDLKNGKYGYIWGLCSIDNTAGCTFTYSNSTAPTTISFSDIKQLHNF